MSKSQSKDGVAIHGKSFANCLRIHDEYEIECTQVIVNIASKNNIWFHGIENRSKKIPQTRTKLSIPNE